MWLQTRIENLEVDESKQLFVMNFTSDERSKFNARSNDSRTASSHFQVSRTGNELGNTNQSITVKAIRVCLNYRWGLCHYPLIFSQFAKNTTIGSYRWMASSHKSADIALPSYQHYGCLRSFFQGLWRNLVAKFISWTSSQVWNTFLMTFSIANNKPYLVASSRNDFACLMQRTRTIVIRIFTKNLEAYQKIEPLVTWWSKLMFSYSPLYGYEPVVGIIGFCGLVSLWERRTLDDFYL